jgi:REP element-mobilizing transposase RayT
VPKASGAAFWGERRGVSPPLQAYAGSIMTAAAVLLEVAQAQALADQLLETAAHRGWRVLALAVMANHVHVVVGVPGDPDPEKLLGDFKAWGTRRLNAGWGRGEHWWSQGTRKPARGSSRRAARRQPAGPKMTPPIQNRRANAAPLADVKMPKRGLEPPLPLQEPAPEAGASANSATSAWSHLTCVLLS